MELQVIAERYAEALANVDATTMHVGVNRRTKQPYQVGLPPMTESTVVPLIESAWQSAHPNELNYSATEVQYPGAGAPRNTKIDHVFSAGHLPTVDVEWGVEIKRLQFVGDNGKNGDHEVAKMLSPYLKDRGILHDALRLQEHGFTRRIAVMGYGFDYNDATLATASSLHTSARASTTVNNVRKLVGRNGPLYQRPLIEFADAILRLRGWTVGPRAEARFDAWRHPAGGAGIVFGWEIRRPALEENFDPRHPW